MYMRLYPWGTAAYTLIFCRADALMLGVLGASMVRNPHWLARLQRRRKYLSTAAACGLVPLIIVTAKGWGMNTRPTSTLGYTLIATFYLVLILAAVVSDGMLRRIFCATWVRGLGTMAYGLYMFHGAVLLLVYAWFGYDQPRIDKAFDVVPMLLALAGALALSHLSWKYFESRLVRTGHRLAFHLQGL
jgi:peptidoglycan/LPS O-acetylase OafA/YrhL